MGAKSIAPVMTLGIAISSTSRIYFFRKNLDWKLLAWLFPATVIGSIFGSALFAHLSSEYLQVIIGIYLISAVVHLQKLKQNKELKPWKAWYFFPIGIVASFLSGLIGGVGPLMNTAYIRYGISKEGIVGTRSMNAVFLHITKLISYTSFGLVNYEILFYGTLVGVFSIIGNYLGKKYLANLSDNLFRFILIFSMVISGIILLIRNYETILTIIQYIQNLIFNKSNSIE